MPAATVTDDSRNGRLSMRRVPRADGQQATGWMWVDDAHRATLARAGLDGFSAMLRTTNGRLLRALSDRENWRLDLAGPNGAPQGAYLKKHHVRRFGYWLRAKLGLGAPDSPGRTEAENIGWLSRVGIPCLKLMAFGERLHEDGLLESFVLTEELAGYTQLDDFLRQRFAELNTPARTGCRAAGFDRLTTRVADVAGRFHRLGYNHRDLYCCHFFIRERAGGDFEVRLIDLQRVQHRLRRRRRWIVKDLAQLAYSAPRQCVSRARRLAFMKAYLGVSKLSPADKRLIRGVLRKVWWMEFKQGPYA
ncbi:MAG: hypothetical protein HYX69_09580 [Planctomycetia bacterium]|nr:hypothetical protein [Planctomycetia bacterium]